jgi:anti-sigma factor RsiW
MSIDREELSRFLDGELPPERARAVAAEVARDPALAAELEALRSLRDDARALRDAESAAPDLWPGIAARLGAGAARPQRRAVRLAAALLGMALLGFGAGWAVFAPRAGAPPQGERFALFLHSTPELEHAHDGAQERAVIARYAGWAQQMHARGALELGDKLRDAEGWELRSGAEQPRTGSDGISGLFILRAPDYDAARALARTCPHVARGGMVELRRIH